jgi:GT2 family glycosyltransferase
MSLKKNLGFARSSLEGLRHANGEYIALLNNDTKFNKGWLEKLIKTMGSDRDIDHCFFQGLELSKIRKVA